MADGKRYRQSKIICTGSSYASAFGHQLCHVLLCCVVSSCFLDQCTCYHWCYKLAVISMCSTPRFACQNHWKNTARMSIFCWLRSAICTLYWLHPHQGLPKNQACLPQMILSQTKIMTKCDKGMGFFLGLSELSHFSGAFSWLIPLIAHVCYANVPVRLDPLASLPLIEGLDSTWCSNIHRPRRLDQKQQKQRLFFMGISWI